MDIVSNEIVYILDENNSEFFHKENENASIITKPIESKNNQHEINSSNELKDNFTQKIPLSKSSPKIFDIQITSSEGTFN